MVDKDLFFQLLLSVFLFVFLVKFDFAFVIETAAILYIGFFGEKILEQIVDNIFGFGGER